MDVLDPADGLQVGHHRVEVEPGGRVLAQHGEDLAPERHGADRDEGADRDRDRGVPHRVPVSPTSTPAAITPTLPAASATTSR